MATEPITPTQLRKDLFKVLDQVVKTGAPAKINRGGHCLKIILDDPGSKLDRLKPIKGLIRGNPDDLLDSGAEWSEEPNL